MNISDAFKRYVLRGLGMGYDRPKTTLEEETSAVSNTDAEDLGSLTVSGLKTMAKERGLSGYSKLKKADLVKLLS